MVSVPFPLLPPSQAVRMINSDPVLVIVRSAIVPAAAAYILVNRMTLMLAAVTPLVKATKFVVAVVVTPTV